MQEFISKKEACKMLDFSYQRFNHWLKIGVFTKYTRKGKSVFLKSEIVDFMTPKKADT